jgi:uncharacterized protein (TIGR02186 family)
MAGGTTARAVVGLVIGAVVAAAPAGAGVVDVQVSPPGVRIGTFFAGSTIEVNGTADACVDVVVEVFGPEEADLFNLKGRVGPLWLNVEEVELKNAPHLYLLLTSGELPSTETLGELELGLEQVEKGIVVHPYSLDKEMVFEQFLRLKRSQGLYDEAQGAIRYQPAATGRRGFQAELFLPSSTAPGVYRVVATAIGREGVVDRSVADLWVAEAGPIKAIHDLAVDHGLIYGVASVIIALVVGGMIGVVFRRVGTH